MLKGDWGKLGRRLGTLKRRLWEAGEKARGN
jgi:hypothetical protein